MESSIFIAFEDIELYDFDLDTFIYTADDEPPKKKIKCKPSKEKLLRTEQKKQEKAFLSKTLHNRGMNTLAVHEVAIIGGFRKRLYTGRKAHLE